MAPKTPGPTRPPDQAAPISTTPGDLPRDACPAIGEFTELHAEVIGMMEEIRDLVLSAARTGSYKTVSAAANDPAFGSTNQ